MANKDECLQCGNLIRDCRVLPIKRKDGGYETAVSYSCGALKLPLPTLTKYDPPGCRWFIRQDNIRI